MRIYMQHRVGTEREESALAVWQNNTDFSDVEPGRSKGETPVNIATWEGGWRREGGSEQN